MMFSRVIFKMYTYFETLKERVSTTQIPTWEKRVYALFLIPVLIIAIPIIAIVGMVLWVLAMIFE